MWWSRLLLPAALALAACGFTPAYGPGGGADALLGNVSVEAPESRAAYLLTQRIEERLGRTDAAPLALSLDVSTDESGVAITPDGRTTRYQMTGEARYALKEGERTLASGAVRDFTGYSASGSTVATLAAKRAARQRLMIILGDRIVDRLILTAPDLPR